MVVSHSSLLIAAALKCPHKKVKLISWKFYYKFMYKFIYPISDWLEPKSIHQIGLVSIVLIGTLDKIGQLEKI